jgi:Trk K+ transport system NAD-binding subunit
MNKKRKVVFTLHAEDKLKLLRKVGVTKEKILKIIENPERLVDGYYGRKIAQGLLSEDLILRVIYEESEGEIMVVTVYPGERRRYE